MPLTAAEAVPFGLGHREWQHYPRDAGDAVEAMTQIILYATARERRALLTANHETFACWIAIGVMQKHIELSIERARSI